jgi:hypothetical protein
LLLLGALAVFDANDFKEKFSTQPSLVLLEEEGNLVAGYSSIMGENNTPSFVSSEQLASYQTKYEQGNLKDVLGQNYKIFIVKKQALDSIDKISAEGPQLTRQDIDNLLASETPIDDFITAQVGNATESQKDLAKQQMLSEISIKDDIEFKGTLFQALFGSAIDKEGPLFIFEQYKQGNITIYPETMMFKVLKRMPLFLMGKLVSGGGE